MARKFVCFIVASACPGEDREGRRGYLLVTKSGSWYQVKTKPGTRLEKNTIVKIYKNHRGVLKWAEVNIQIATKLKSKISADDLAVLWASSQD